MDRGVVRGACHALRQIASTGIQYEHATMRIEGVREPVLLGDTQKRRPRYSPCPAEQKNRLAGV
jgi:hypothetical protein